MALRDAASKQQQKTTCINSKVQALGYDCLPKRTCRAAIADGVVFFSKNVAVQPGLCRTWSETLKTGFLTTRLIFEADVIRMTY